MSIRLPSRPLNILVCGRVGGAWGFITDGYINALRDKGHRVARWDGHLESWEDFNPDLYIGCSGHKQPIPTRRNAKVAIQVNPFGPIKIKGINESQDNINWVVEQRPNVVFGYGGPEDEIIWTYWTKRHQIPWVPMANAGDRTIYKRTSAQRVHDVVYVGGRWAYKGITIDAYLLPVLKEVNYKLYGWGDWPAGICSGPIPDDQVCSFFNSGKVAPCISEKHTHDHGIDIPERAFKVALCGALVVHDPTMSIKKFMPSALVAPTAEKFKEYVKHFCQPSNAKERDDLAENQRQEVLANHTYHHRMAGLLAVCDFNAESADMLR